MSFVVTKKGALQFLGMAALGVFFYLYGVGNAVGMARYYPYVFCLVELIALAMLIYDKTFFGRYRQYYAWQFVFILFISFSALYTINTEHALAQIMAVLKILLKVSVVAIICSDFDGIKKLMTIFSCLGGLSFGTLLLTGKLYEGWRLGTELLGNANSFALIITIFMTGAMYCMVSSTNKYIRWMSIVCFALDLYMIFLSGGRKFLLYGIVFLYVSFLISNSGRIKLRNIVAATALVGVIVYIGYYVILHTPALYNAIGIRLIGLGTQGGALGVSDQNSLMTRGIEMFLKRPFWGWGIGGFQQYSANEFGTYVYAHSNYIELLADFGIFGTMIYYSQYFLCFIKMMEYKSFANPDEQKLFMPLLVAISVIDIFSITFNQTAFIPLFVMLISGYAYELRQRAMYTEGYNEVI